MHMHAIHCGGYLSVAPPYDYECRHRCTAATSAKTPRGGDWGWGGANMSHALCFAADRSTSRAMHAITIILALSLWVFFFMLLLLLLLATRRVMCISRDTRYNNIFLVCRLRAVKCVLKSETNKTLARCAICFQCARAVCVGQPSIVVHINN